MVLTVVENMYKGRQLMFAAATVYTCMLVFMKILPSTL